MPMALRSCLFRISGWCEEGWGPRGLSALKISHSSSVFRKQNELEQKQKMWTLMTIRSLDENRIGRKHFQREYCDPSFCILKFKL